jgi:cytochrome P450
MEDDSKRAATKELVSPSPVCPFHAGSNGFPSTLLIQETLLDPFDVYKMLRSERPVAFIPDQNIWIISRYDDCKFVLEHPQKFSSKEAVSSTNAYRRSPEALEILKRSKASPRARTLIMSDPPEHDRYREILHRALAPGQTVRALTPKMKLIIDELIDGFCERGACEFVQEFAYPLPMRVVAAILDMPDDQINMLKAWSDDFIAVQAGNIPDERIVSSARRTLEFEEFILRKVDDRRRELTDDFLGRLVNQPTNEEKLSVPELLNICLQVLVGGNETTTNFLGSVLFTIVSQPGLLEDIRYNGARIPQLIEEILRAESPLQGLFRIATEDHAFGDVVVPRGAKLMLCFGSANRDETYYGTGEFDPTRDYKQNMHLAFGHGIHACAGQAFARRESVLAMEALVKRLPGLRLSDKAPPMRQMLFGIRGFKELHIEFDPAFKVSVLPAIPAHDTREV